MKLFSLALRNLLRNRRRTTTTLAAIVVGLSALLVFGGYVRNNILAIQTGYVKYHGHLQIQRQGYFLFGSANPVAFGIDDYQRVIDIVKHDSVLQPMLEVVTPMLRLNGIAGNFSQGISQSIVAMGVVAVEQNRMRKWNDYDSLDFEPLIRLEGTPDDAVVIGTGVARSLRLCEPLQVENCVLPPEDTGSRQASADGVDAPSYVADLAALEQSDEQSTGATRIELLAASAGGAPNVASLDVVKAENWGPKEIDDLLIVMHLDQAQRLVFGQAQPQVTAIQIQLQHTAQMKAAKARLAQLLANELESMPLEVLDYETLTPVYGQTIQFLDSIFGFISVLIYVIVLFMLGNTMSMAIVERTAEIGTLRAIGLRRSGIRNLFVCEGLLIGVIGVVLGFVVALPVAYLINHSGLTWMPPGYSFKYPVIVRIWGDYRLIFGSAISLIAVAVVSAWWPAKRAAKLDIVDALRHV